jgi:hypothetical protein
MKATYSSDAIGRVMNSLRYSLASYLQFARPWVDAHSQVVADTIAHVAASHNHDVTRIGELLVERHGHVVSQTFPAAFAALNDLSMRYVLPLVLEDERQIVRLMEAAIVELEVDAEAYNLVAELVDRERRQVRILQRLLDDPRANRICAPVQAMPHASMWPTAVDGPKVLTPRMREPVPKLVSC